MSEGYFWGLSRLRRTVTELTLWKRNDCQQGPPRPIKSMQTWITLRHCCQSTADEGQRIKGFWLTFLGAWWALLGFHWLANERLVQRHWTDKNKVTCLASDEDFFFFLSLVFPWDTNDLGSSAARHLIWPLNTVGAPHILDCSAPTLSVTYSTSSRQAHMHTLTHTHPQIQTYVMYCVAKYLGLCLQNRMKHHLLVDRHRNCSWLLK